MRLQMTDGIWVKCQHNLAVAAVMDFSVLVASGIFFLMQISLTFAYVGIEKCARSIQAIWAPFMPRGIFKLWIYELTQECTALFCFVIDICMYRIYRIYRIYVDTYKHKIRGWACEMLFIKQVKRLHSVQKQQNFLNIKTWLKSRVYSSMYRSYIHGYIWTLSLISTRW